MRQEIHYMCFMFVADVLGVGGMAAPAVNGLGGDFEIEDTRHWHNDMFQQYCHQLGVMNSKWLFLSVLVVVVVQIAAC